ncbi:MAG: SpoIIE family protein phosphatase [Pseudomonadales bacterium]
MRVAALPKDEHARLYALSEYGVLDTLPEQSYDDVVAIAAQICGVPIALVSLVDEHRQWFKSKTGLDATQTPRALAFCAHAILRPTEIMVVNDAQQDVRFADNPLVTSEPFVRFYAGAPLVTSQGQALGTLCVIDRRPRELTDGQLASLRALARQVVALLELRLNLEKVDQKSLELERSRQELTQLCEMLESQIIVSERDLQRAEVIQRSLLPHEAPPVDNFCIQSWYEPGRTVGGDLFDVVGLADGYIAIIMADAAGHGVGAAMLSLLFKQHLKLADKSGSPRAPKLVLTEVNEALADELAVPGAFVTAIVCVVDTNNQQMVLASAGHPPALLLRADGQSESIDSTGPALGLYAGAEYTERSASLASGDRLFLYTDGLFDLREADPPDLQEIADRVAAIESGTGLEALLQYFSGSQRNQDPDDVTMLLLDTKPGESHFFESASSIESAIELDDVKITYAETNAETYLALVGRVTWTCGSTFLEAAVAVLDAGRTLRLDLGGCEYLDSTMLGTLYEVVEHADDILATVSIHGVSESLRLAFEELRLTSVIENIDSATLQAPARTYPLRSTLADEARHTLRLLKSHDKLARLSPENRLEFGKLVDMLRDEVTIRFKS